MKKELPLIDNTYVLERIPGKGGWTYARIPEVLKDGKKAFGLVKVKGSIDGYAFKQYHLMPMGNGCLFLPVKAEIRKKIKKQQGDKVHIVLYADNDPLEIPEELLDCLSDEPAALTFFNTLNDSEKKYYIQWIYAAKREETRVERIAKSIVRLQKGEKFYMVKPKEY